MEDALKKQEVPVAIGEKFVAAFVALKRLLVARKAEAACGALLLLLAVNLFAAISR